MILGIDPGTTESAYVLLHKRCIVSSAILPNFELRALLQQLTGYRVMGIEGMQSYGLPIGQEVLSTVVWIGRFIEASAAPAVWPVFRPAVRAHFVGVAKRGNTDKAIRSLMITRYGKEHTKGLVDDEWSALAVASYVQDKLAGGETPPQFPTSMMLAASDDLKNRKTMNSKQ